MPLSTFFLLSLGLIAIAGLSLSAVLCLVLYAGIVCSIKRIGSFGRCSCRLAALSAALLFFVLVYLLFSQVEI